MREEIRREAGLGNGGRVPGIKVMIWKVKSVFMAPCIRLDV
jgi:hypothetical protein